MKKLVLGAMLLPLLAACASKEVKEAPKASVEERPAAQKPAEAKPMAQPPIAVNPLKDPNNILSKRSIYYDFDKSDIKDEYKPLIIAHGKYLTDHRDAHVTVQGNADERGSREYNLALGQRRAFGAKNAMMVLGVSDKQVDTVSFGKEKPRCAEHNEECWSQNRRSDIVYQGE